MSEGDFDSLDQIEESPVYVASPMERADLVRPIIEIDKPILITVNIGIITLLLASVVYNNYIHLTLDNLAIGYLASVLFYGMVSFHYYTISKYGIKSRYGILLFISINLFYISIIIVSFTAKIDFINAVELILLNYVFGAVLYGIIKAAIFLIPTGNIVKYLIEFCLCLISVLLIVIKK
jgi:hypothetical protein